MAVHKSLWPGQIYRTVMFELDWLKEQIREFGLDLDTDIDVCEGKYYLRTIGYRMEKAQYDVG